MLTVNLDKVLKDLDANVAGRTDYQIFMRITKHMNDEGVSTVPQSLLSEETGFKRRTVSNSIKRLAEKGFFTIERNMTEHGGIATNIYHINHRYLLETKPVEHSQTKTRSCVQETQKTAPGCVNLEKALAELETYGASEKSKKIFALIASHADRNGKARVLMHEIKTETRMSWSTIKDAIDYLTRIGFLKVSKERVNTTGAHVYRNVYTINQRFLGKRTPQDSACVKPCCSDMNEMRRLARIGEVAADVIKEILAIYENKESK